MTEPTDSSTYGRLVKSRHSCRAFLAQPVPRQIIEDIIEAAQQTASWCNTQPWQLVITAGQGTERFREALLAQAHNGVRQPDFEFPREYAGIYRDRRRSCGLQLYDSLEIVLNDRDASAAQAMRNFELFGAPHVAIISTPEALGVYGAVDCGAYVNNFMLAAHSMGVASIAQASLALQSSFIREFFDIAEGRKIVCGISFGYEDTEHPANAFRTDRSGVKDVLQWVLA